MTGEMVIEISNVIGASECQEQLRTLMDVFKAEVCI